MNIDDVLFGIIVCGIGLAGACFRSEYVLLRELRATERRRQRLMRELHVIAQCIGNHDPVICEVKIENFQGKRRPYIVNVK
jgi:hypothetical protein